MTSWLSMPIYYVMQKHVSPLGGVETTSLRCCICVFRPAPRAIQSRNGQQSSGASTCGDADEKICSGCHQTAQLGHGESFITQPEQTGEDLTLPVTPANAKRWKRRSSEGAWKAYPKPPPAGWEYQGSAGRREPPRRGCSRSFSSRNTKWRRNR